MNYKSEINFKESEWQNYDLIQQYDNEIKDSNQKQIGTYLVQLIISIMASSISIIYSIQTVPKERGNLPTLLFAFSVLLMAYVILLIVFLAIKKITKGAILDAFNYKTDKSIKKMVYGFKYKIIPEVLLCEQLFMNLSTQTKAEVISRRDISKYYLNSIIEILYSCLFQYRKIDNEIISDEKKVLTFFYLNTYVKHRIGIDIYQDTLKILLNISNDIQDQILSKYSELLDSDSLKEELYKQKLNAISEELTLLYDSVEKIKVIFDK